MPKTRIIIEGEGVSPFPESLLRCNYCGSKGVAAWIGLKVRDMSDDSDSFPWQERNYKTDEECGLFPEEGLITVTVEHDGEVKDSFTCPVTMMGVFPGGRRRGR